MSDHFYSRLPVYDDFSVVSDLSKYSNLPDDWYIIAADIEDSTTAIQAGHYKSVNIIGVSVITAVRNLTSSLELPYMFGGDGATLCIPFGLIEDAKEALLATKLMAKNQFNLNLRVGIVPIDVVRKKGRDVLVSRYRVSEYYVQVAFAGGGIEYAENLIKDKNKGSQYRFDEIESEVKADYSGLECRWERVPSQHGETIALIVKALAPTIEQEAKIYDEIISMIHQIYGEDKSCQPVYAKGLMLTINSEKLSDELKTKTFNQGFFKRLLYKLKSRLEIVIGWVLMSFKLNVSGIPWGQYKKDIVSNTDFKKFDGVLREVISGTTKQREKLNQYLNKKHILDECVYGIHVSNSALVTCMVDDRLGDHYHFVDASDGGYALAAMQMKLQIKKAGL